MSREKMMGISLIALVIVQLYLQIRRYLKETA